MYITRISEDLNVISESIREIFKPWNSFRSKIIESGIIEHINKSFQIVGEALKNFSDDIIVFKSIIVELGYPPNYDIPIPYVIRIVEDFREHGLDYVKEYIDEMMKEFYNEEFMNGLLNNWEQDGELKSRIHILRDLLKCHNNGFYNASIPTVLPQIEGIIAEKFQHIGLMKGFHQEIYLEKLLINPINTEKDLNMDQVLQQYFGKFILVGFKHGKEITSDISRHAILHGGLKEYGTQFNSIKLILLFDYLRNSIKKIDDEMIKEARKDIRKRNK